MRKFNSTVKVNQRACKSCGRQKFIFSRGRCADCARIEDNQDVEVEDMKNGESMAYLINDLDTLCSLIVRMSSANPEGIAECYTCRTPMRWQELQAGHYIGRCKSSFLRWDFRNLRPQCEYCNCNKHGNLAEYGKRLELDKPGITEYLLTEANGVHSWSRDELRGMIKDFTQQVAALKKRFNPSV